MLKHQMNGKWRISLGGVKYVGDGSVDQYLHGGTDDEVYIEPPNDIVWLLRMRLTLRVTSVPVFLPHRFLLLYHLHLQAEWSVGVANNYSKYCPSLFQSLACL